MGRLLNIFYLKGSSQSRLRQNWCSNLKRDEANVYFSGLLFINSCDFLTPILSTISDSKQKNFSVKEKLAGWYQIDSW